MGSKSSIALIGCGLTGTAMFYQFVHGVKKRSEIFWDRSLQVLVFEKSPCPGPGLPYSEKNVFSCHLCNMPATEMSIDAGNPDDFINWLKKNRSVMINTDQTLEPLMSEIDFNRPETLFVPRMVMGEYLKNRFHCAVKTAGDLGISVRVYLGMEVVDIRENPDGLKILAAQSPNKKIKQFEADYALLSTGHWFPESKHRKYVSSPWPAAELLERIPAGTSTAILGTSLSAIDTALTLFSDGRFVPDDNGGLKFMPGEQTRNAVMYSRNGFLPKVRGRKGTYRNTYFCESRLDDWIEEKQGRLSLDDLFQLFKKEMDRAYGKNNPFKPKFSLQQDPLLQLKTDIVIAQNGDNPGGDVLWQTILSQTTPLLKKIYLILDPAEKARFAKNYKSAFMGYAVAIPLINAEKICALLRSGVLSVQRVKPDYKLESGSNGFQFKTQASDRIKKYEIDHDFVVDATGQKVSWRTNASDLAQNMISSGMVRLASEKDGGPGSLMTDPQTHQVEILTDGGHPEFSKRLFAVGVMNQGQVINASMAWECAVSTNKAIQYIMKGLINRR